VCVVCCLHAASIINIYIFGGTSTRVVRRMYVSYVVRRTHTCPHRAQGTDSRHRAPACRASDRHTTHITHPTACPCSRPHRHHHSRTCLLHDSTQTTTAASTGSPAPSLASPSRLCVADQGQGTCVVCVVCFVVVLCSVCVLCHSVLCAVRVVGGDTTSY